jgi:hypothetical protein
MADGVASVGPIFTARITCGVGPLHPLAITWMSTEPKNPFAHVIIPVAGLILPAAGLLIDQFKPVLLTAVVE